MVWPVAISVMNLNKIVLCDVYFNTYAFSVSVVNANVKLEICYKLNDLRVLNLFVQTFSYLLCFLI